MTHPNIIAGCLREAAVLFGTDPFDPDSQEDRDWFAKTFHFMLDLTATQEEAGPMVTAPLVEATFPGAVEVPVQANPTLVAAPAPATVAPQYPAVAPAPAHTPAPTGAIHSHSPKDEQWANLVMELQQGGPHTWWDNRIEKRSPQSPDFRHKDLDAAPNRAGKVYKLGLYLADAPDFALQVLAQYPPR